MVTNPANSPTSQPKLESLTHVDISRLSQSELHVLSLCSSSAFDLRRTDDVIIPKIDRFIFNESAGSRRQTYSRLRPAAAPRKPHQSTASVLHHHRLSGLLPTPKPRPIPDNDPERSENKKIVNILKNLIENNRPLNDPGGSTDEVTELSKMERRLELSAVVEMPIAMNFGGRKRKRGRKPNVKVDNGKVLDIMNSDGVVVDLVALANMVDPYGDELRNRTVGLGTEEEFLGFMKGLEGQWGSTRRKRKIVNASDFGDAFPVGWKLLLGLKRKEGRVSLYCRRYISPSGQQFATCNEASSYLQSYFGQNSSMQFMDLTTEDIQQASEVVNGSPAGIMGNRKDLREDIITSSTLHSTLSIEYEKEVSLSGMENLAEVQVRDLFECHKCNIAFDEKDTYLQHLMSSHQKTTRRYRLGSSVGKGVIVNNGKYECQFCHKIFEERHRYNSHVGSHVRNCVRRSEMLPGQVTVQESMESPCRDALPPRASKMAALIEIAQNSILEASVVRPNDELKGDSIVDKLNVLCTPEIASANPDPQVIFDSSLSKQEFENSTIYKKLDQGLNKQDSECMIPEETTGIDTVGKIDTVSNMIPDIPAATPDDDPKFDAMDKLNESKLESCSGRSTETDNNVLNGSMQQSSKEDELLSRISDSSMPLMQSLSCYPLFYSVSDKGEGEFSNVDQKLDNITGFEELKLDEIETFNFGSVAVQELTSLQEVHMNMANNAVMERGFDSSLQFDTEEVMLNMAGIGQLTTVCVWCRNEFNHEPIDSELESDFVGFMCPTCKTKISGQLNVINSS